MNSVVSQSVATSMTIVQIRMAALIAKNKKVSK